MSNSEPHEESIEHVLNVPHGCNSNIRKQNANNVTQMSVCVIYHTQMSSERDESITCESNNFNNYCCVHFYMSIHCSSSQITLMFREYLLTRCLT